MFRLCILLAGLALAYGGILPNIIANNNCGQPAIPRTNPFIVGGQEAKAHTYPWMISLTSRNSHICGATLISHNFAITAAHCVPCGRDGAPVQPSNYRLVLGAHSRSNTDSGQLTVNVQVLRCHASYNANTLSNDIALLQMDRSVAFSDTISPACIATKDYPAGTMTTVTGWGTMSSGAGSLPDRLMEVDVPLISHSQCNTWNSGGVNAATMICAGLEEGGKDSCQGDSGGPLVIPEGGKWYLAGVVSWGYGCAAPRRPGVYTRVCNYLQWFIDYSDVQAG